MSSHETGPGPQENGRSTGILRTIGERLAGISPLGPIDNGRSDVGEAVRDLDLEEVRRRLEQDRAGPTRQDSPILTYGERQAAYNHAVANYTPHSDAVRAIGDRENAPGDEASQGTGSPFLRESLEDRCFRAGRAWQLAMQTPYTLLEPMGAEAIPEPAPEPPQVDVTTLNDYMGPRGLGVNPPVSYPDPLRDAAIVANHVWSGLAQRPIRLEEIITIGPLGRSARTLFYWPEADRIATGCFEGPREAFEAELEQTYMGPISPSDGQRLQEYRLAVSFLRLVKAVRNPGGRTP